MKIFVVDDEQIVLTSVRRLLRRRGMTDVKICDKGKDAVEIILSNDFDIVLLDVLMPDIDGLQVLDSTKAHKPQTEFIMVTAVEDVATSVRAIRMGAYDYLVKPVDPERLYMTIERAFERKGLKAGQAGSLGAQRGPAIPEDFSEIITRNPRMIELIRYAHIVARSGLPILVCGESGTGKELFARSIHRTARSARKPFVPVNVAAIPETLFESQFLGHAAGAFTGATGEHIGYFEQADEGTLYMDEIGELPSAQQVKFLRVLEDRTITRLGENQPKEVDVQIVASTNADLETACREGRFRLDLYYRINTGMIHVPPLRERVDDLPLLAEHFLSIAAHRFDKPIRGFSSAAMDALAMREFPGNIRELIGVINNAVLMCEDDSIQTDHLGQPIQEASLFSRRPCTLKEAAEEHVAYILTHNQDSLQKTADTLGISVRQVQRRLADMRESPRWAKVLSQM